jgi:MFS family permease
VRRLLLSACLVVFIDVAFFEAITPLLAGYRNDLGLSKGEAGVLVGAYAAGAILASIPAGLAAGWLGPRRVIIAGLLVFAVSGIAFGFSHSYELLVATRLLQGLAAASMWSGALTWLINSFPAEQRGSVIGTALGVAVAGALIGPAIGALADRISTEVVFTVVGVAAILIVFAVVSIPDATVRESNGLSEIIRSMVAGPVMFAAVLVIAPSIMFGAVAVLVPLQIDSLGGSALLVAAGFAVGAAMEAALSPLVGRFSDRRGRMLPFAIGASVGAATILLVPIHSIPLVLGGLMGAAVGAGMTFGPAFALLADNAERVGLHQGPATAVANLAWAVGQLIGAAAGGALAEVGGEILPCLLVMAMLVAVSVPAWRRVAEVGDG